MTVQVGDVDAVTDIPLTVHPAPVTVRLTAPEPLPPVVVTRSGVPATPVSVVLLIDSAC